MSICQNDMKIFGNLFVLEAANNHCGDIERGLKLIRDHAVVARQNNQNTMNSIKKNINKNQ